MNFTDFGLRPEVLKSLGDLGFETPTPIQEEAIPQLISTNSDLVGLAQTGTGKTAAFGLPLIQHIDFEASRIQGLILAPTRELGIQIAEDLKIFTKYIKGAKISTIYGGASIDKQAKEVRQGAQIVVATPGRLMDMMRRGIVRLEEVKKVILDEADEMLNMGFKEDIDEILEGTPKTKNVWLFSATMPNEVARIAKFYMKDPIEITVGSKNSSAENLEHIYYAIRERDRYPALKRVIDFHPDIYGVIFCRTKRSTQEIADKLMRDGYNAEALHGDLSQLQRDTVMKKYRDKTLQVLVATDVAARGIDVSNITHVINYNLPEDIENYTHRSGRTARAGKKGVSIALVSPKEVGKIKSIERQIKTQFVKGHLPSGNEVCREQLMSLIDKIQAVEVKEDEIAEYIPSILEKFEHASKEDVIKKFVSSEFNRFLEYYQSSFNLNIDVDDRSARDRSKRTDSDDKQRFHVNIGEKNGLNKGAVMRLICDNAKLHSKDVGRIDLYNDFAFFEADKELTTKILTNMQNIEFEGITFSVEKAKAASGAPNPGRSSNKPRSTGRRDGRKEFKGNGGKSSKPTGGGGQQKSRGASARRRRS